MCTSGLPVLVINFQNWKLTFRFGFKAKIKFAVPKRCQNHQLALPPTQIQLGTLQPLFALVVKSCTHIYTYIYMYMFIYIYTTSYTHNDLLVFHRSFENNVVDQNSWLDTRYTRTYTCTFTSPEHPYTTLITEFTYTYRHIHVHLHISLHRHLHVHLYLQTCICLRLCADLH